MTFGSRGHYAPMAPLVQAMRAAGHDVAVASSPGFRASVNTPGVEFLPVGIDAPDALAAFNQRPRSASTDSIDEIVTGMFVDVWVPAVLADVHTLLDWRPDVIIREEGEFAAPLVAQLAGVPCAEHSWGPVRPRRQVDAAAAALAPIWRANGVEPDPLCGFYRSLYLDICPPTLQFEEADDIPVRRLLRATAPPSSGDMPTWAAHLGDRPVVYVTLGTVPRYNSDSEFFQAAAEGLVSLDAEIVITVGPTGDPSLIASSAPNVHIERFVPQASIMRHCQAVVTHGGSGSVLGALAFGSPLLCVPAASPSQQRNTEAVVRSGAGRSLDRGEVTPYRLRTEVVHLMTERSHVDAAKAIAAEIAAMPSVEHGVLCLEELADARR
jgi:UDP:flavonoid glycosyltransferase YjiC (YdhE family)